MRPLGIVLAIVSATLIFSFPEYVNRYSQIYSDLPTTILLVAFLLLPVAIGVAIVEAIAQNDDADRAAKAAKSSAALAVQAAAGISRIANVLEAQKAAGAVTPGQLAADRELESWLQRQIDQRFQELAQKAAELSRIADVLTGKTTTASATGAGPPPASP